MSRTHLRDPLPDVPEDLLRRAWTWVVLCDAFWTLGIAAAVLIGGPRRMSTVSYAGLRDITDTLSLSVMWWAAPPALAGVALLYGLTAGRPGWRVAAYVVGMVIAGSMTAAFAWSVPQSPSAGLTALPTYTYVALNHVPVLVLAAWAWLRRDVTTATDEE